MRHFGDNTVKTDLARKTIITEMFGQELALRLTNSFAYKGFGWVITKNIDGGKVEKIYFDKDKRSKNTYYLSFKTPVGEQPDEPIAFCEPVFSDYTGVSYYQRISQILKKSLVEFSVHRIGMSIGLETSLLIANDKNNVFLLCGAKSIKDFEANKERYFAELFKCLADNGVRDCNLSIYGYSQVNGAFAQLVACRLVNKMVCESQINNTIANLKVHTKDAPGISAALVGEVHDLVRAKPAILAKISVFYFMPERGMKTVPEQAWFLKGLAPSVKLAQAVYLGLASEKIDDFDKVNKYLSYFVMGCLGAFVGGLIAFSSSTAISIAATALGFAFGMVARDILSSASHITEEELHKSYMHFAAHERGNIPSNLKMEVAYNGLEVRELFTSKANPVPQIESRLTFQIGAQILAYFIESSSKGREAEAGRF